MKLANILAFQIVKRIQQTENEPWSNLELSKWIEEILIEKGMELTNKPIEQILGTLPSKEEWEAYLKDPQSKIDAKKHRELLNRHLLGE